MGRFHGTGRHQVRLRGEDGGEYEGFAGTQQFHHRLAPVGRSGAELDTALGQDMQVFWLLPRTEQIGVAFVATERSGGRQGIERGR